MRQFTVYGLPGSPYVRAVQMGLEEKRASYRLQPLDFGQSKGPEHLQRHAFGRVPAFEHGGFGCRRRRRSCDISTARSVVIVVQRIIGPRFLGRQTDESAIAAVLPHAQLCVNERERLLDSPSFMASEQLSLADLMLAPQLDNLALTPEGKPLLAGTQLEAWLPRANTRPSMKATRPSEVPEKLA